MWVGARGPRAQSTAAPAKSMRRCAGSSALSIERSSGFRRTACSSSGSPGSAPSAVWCSARSRHFGVRTVSALLCRRRDCSPDLGRGRRDELRARRGPPQEPPVSPLGHKVHTRVRTDQDRGPESASSAATRTSPTRPPTPTTTHASTTANKPTYPLAGGSPPLRFPRRAPPKTRIDYSYSPPIVA